MSDHEPDHCEDCGTTTGPVHETQWGFLCYDCEEAVHLDLHADHRLTEHRYGID